MGVSLNFFLLPCLFAFSSCDDVAPADYVLFVDKKPVGIIEAKKKRRRTTFGFRR